jgi:hypothetical protein
MPALVADSRRIIAPPLPAARPAAFDRSPSGPADAELADYLARHDAACPCCGYNLRGSTASACPECGTHVSLGLRMGDALARRRGLLLLVFLWVLLAGSMNTVRTGREVYGTATAAA